MATTVVHSLTAVQGPIKGFNTTDSTSSSSGGAIFSGGIGIAKNLNVGGALSASSLKTTGIVTVTAKYTILDSDSVIRVNGFVPITVTMPNATFNTGRLITVVNAGTGGVVLAGAWVCGRTAIVLLDKYESIQLVSNGAQWDGVGHDQDKIDRWTNFCSLFRFSPDLATLQQSPQAATPVIHYNKLKLPNQQPSYKYDYEVATTPHTAFFGGLLLLPDGQVLSGRDNSSSIVRTLTGAIYATDGTLPIQPWCSFVLLPNGNVCLIPYRSPRVGLFRAPYNTDTNYLAGPDHGHSYLSPNAAFMGGVLTKNTAGNWVVVMVPHGAPNIGLYYPSEDVNQPGTYANGPSVGAETTSFRFSGAVIASNGKIVFGCFDSTEPNIGVYNPTDGATGSFVRVAVTLGWGYLCPSLCLDGTVVMGSRTGHTCAYDPVNNSVLEFSNATRPSTLTLPNGHIIMLSDGNTPPLIRAPLTNSVTELPINIPSTWTGRSCVLPDGRVCIATWVTSTVRFLHTGMHWPVALATHTLFNKF